MAGQFDIQRVARGLLDMLAMKSTGSTPVQLAPFMQSTVDVLELYLQDNRLVSNPSVSSPTAGYNTGSTVPAGELWIVNNISVLTQTAAGGPFTFCPAYASPLGQAFTLGNYVTMPTGQNVRNGWQLERMQLILGPNWQTGCYFHTMTGLPTAVSVTTDYYRLLI